MSVKVGNLVHVINQDGWSGIGRVHSVLGGEDIHIYKDDDGKSTWWVDRHHYVVIEPNSTAKNMNLKEKMALVFKGEPEKSFIKAGVMNVDETLTTDGNSIFMTWLLKKNGAAFKKEVVDPILEDQECEE